MKRITQSATALILLLAAALMGACTKEDVTMCGIDVVFKFDYNMEEADKFASEIDWVELYVFAEDGTFVDKFTYQGPFEELFRTRLDLPAGIYDFIVWGNPSQQYYRMDLMQPTGSRLSEGTLSLIAQGNGRVEEFPGDLYHGARMRVEAKAFGTEVLVSMVKNTNKVQAVFKGLPIDESNTGDFICRIEANNGDYTFENNLTGNRLMSYIPQSRVEFQTKAVMTHDFVTMRLFPTETTRAEGKTSKCNSRIILEYRPEGGNAQTILNASLPEAIENQYREAVDFDRQDEFVIEFEYSGDFAFGNYTISVNGWIAAQAYNGWIW